MRQFLFLLSLVLVWSGTAQAQQKRDNKTTPAPPPLEQGVTTGAGKRVGKWNFFTRQQELELTFDYDSSRITFMRDDTARYLVRQNDQWVLRRVARPPHILGSADHRLSSIQRRLRYPVSALRQQLEGTVLIAYTVDTNGHTTDYSVESSVSPDCDQEVWRVLQEQPDLWIPAVYLGRPTPARFYVAVRFQISFDREAQPTKAPALPPHVRPAYTGEIFVTALGLERRTGR